MTSRRAVITQTVAILVFDHQRVAILPFRCGLRRGGPLSCLLYVFAVDPLLCAFAAVPGVLLTLGFVDDWLAAVKDSELIPRL